MTFLGYHDQVHRGGGALILNRANEALLLLRGAASRNDRGLWSQPGGAIDEGDPTPEAAVRREILEELGVDVRIKRFLTTTCHSDQDRQWLAYSYLGHVEAGQARRREPEKHESIGWFPLDQLPENLSHVTRDAVDAYQASEGREVCAGVLVFDMDGTLLPGTTANLELARILGAERMVLELERSYHAGLIDNHTYASKILDMYGQLSADHVEDAFQRAPKLNGLRELVGWARARGIQVAALTTGPAFFASKFTEHLEFDHVMGGVFPVHTGAIEMSSCNVLRDADKPERASELCGRLGIGANRCVVVGDSRSDLALFDTFKSSIALNWDKILAGRARYYLKTRFAPDLIPAVAHLLR
ncbi:MAG: HAD-IB family phosphatase [Byssovorax sp.]